MHCLEIIIRRNAAAAGRAAAHAANDGDEETLRRVLVAHDATVAPASGHSRAHRLAVDHAFNAGFDRGRAEG